MKALLKIFSTLNVKTAYFFAFLLSLASLVFSCKRMEQSSPPVVITNGVSSILDANVDPSEQILRYGGLVTDQTAYVTAFVVSGTDIDSRGVCVSPVPMPTRYNKDTVDSQGGLGRYVLQLTRLAPNTTYYMRAFVTTKAGVTTYGNQVIFKTLPSSFPSFGALTITDTSSTSAKAYVNVLTSGVGPVIERGVTWSPNGFPTVDGPNPSPHTVGGKGLGAFNVPLKNLSENVRYLVRGYAKNIGGTSYSDTVSFITPTGLPVLLTPTATFITDSSALLGCNFFKDGDHGPVIYKSLLLSTNPNPKVGDSTTREYNLTNSKSRKVFIKASIPSNNTVYYLRSAAINSRKPKPDTAYSPQITFTTLGYALVDTVRLIPAYPYNPNDTSFDIQVYVINNGGYQLTEARACFSDTSYINPNEKRTVCLPAALKTGLQAIKIHPISQFMRYYLQVVIDSKRGEARSPIFTYP